MYVKCHVEIRDNFTTYRYRQQSILKFLISKKDKITFNYADVKYCNSTFLYKGRSGAREHLKTKIENHTHAGSFQLITCETLLAIMWI